MPSRWGSPTRDDAQQVPSPSRTPSTRATDGVGYVRRRILHLGHQRLAHGHHAATAHSPRDRCSQCGRALIGMFTMCAAALWLRAIEHGLHCASPSARARQARLVPSRRLGHLPHRGVVASGRRLSHLIHLVLLLHRSPLARGRQQSRSSAPRSPDSTMYIDISIPQLAIRWLVARAKLLLDMCTYNRYDMWEM
jgi:hypothetical protein